MDQFQQLLDIYTDYPCRTLPNAFWKTAADIEQSHLVMTMDEGDSLSSLAIWQGKRLMALWCAQSASHPLRQTDIEAVSFALVHESARPIFDRRNFPVKRPYFRLTHTGGFDHTRLPAGFAFACFKPTDDVDAAVNLIQACYEKIHVTPDIVRTWMRHPVYDPDLWLWVIDLETGEKSGLGIAERDSRVPEASLEWIQVHPAFQGRGLGKAIVTELLRRVAESVKFTTVSGELENLHHPDLLYRRCGFRGEDVWWMLSDER